MWVFQMTTMLTTIKEEEEEEEEEQEQEQQQQQQQQQQRTSLQYAKNCALCYCHIDTCGGQVLR